MVLLRGDDALQRRDLPAAVAAYESALTMVLRQAHALAGIGLTHLFGDKDMSAAMSLLTALGNSSEYLPLYLAANFKKEIGFLSEAAHLAQRAAIMVPPGASWAPIILRDCKALAHAEALVAKMALTPAAGHGESRVAQLREAVGLPLPLEALVVLANAASECTAAAVLHEYRTLALAALPAMLGGSGVVVVPRATLVPTAHANACAAVAAICWRSGESAPAVVVLKAALRELPEHATGAADTLLTLITSVEDNHRAGNAAFRENRLDAAMEAYRQALDLCRDWRAPPSLAVNLWSNVAACWFAMADYGASTEAALAGLALDPNHSKVRLRTARSLAAEGKLAEAEKHLAIIIRGTYRGRRTCRAALPTRAHPTVPPSPLLV